MPFDPDQYLADAAPAAPSPVAGGFDPDAYLSGAQQPQPPTPPPAAPDEKRDMGLIGVASVGVLRGGATGRQAVEALGLPGDVASMEIWNKHSQGIADAYTKRGTQGVFAALGDVERQAQQSGDRVSAAEAREARLVFQHVLMPQALRAVRQEQYGELSDKDLKKGAWDSPFKDTSVPLPRGSEGAVQAKLAEMFSTLGDAYKRDVVEATTKVGELEKYKQGLSQREDVQKFEQADGLWGALGALADSPVAVVLALASEAMPASLPVMGAGAAGGVVAGPVGAGAAAGSASYKVEQAHSILAGMQEAGVDLTSTESVSAFLRDPVKRQEVMDKATRRGATIALVDAITSGFAGRFVNAARRSAGQAATMGAKVAKHAGAAGSEVLLGSAGEGLGEYLATLAAGDEVRAKDILAEAIGGIGQNFGAAVGNVISDVREERATRPRVQGEPEPLPEPPPSAASDQQPPGEAPQVPQSPAVAESGVPFQPVDQQVGQPQDQVSSVGTGEAATSLAEPPNGLPAEPSSPAGGAEIPLGLSRDPVLDGSLSALSAGDLEDRYVALGKSLDRMEMDSEFDVNGGDPEWRARLAEVQDQYDAVEHEMYRRDAMELSPEDLWQRAMDLRPRRPSDRLRMMLLVDAIRARGLQEEVARQAVDYAKRGSHENELAGWIMRDLEAAGDDLGQQFTPPPRGAPSTSSPGPGAETQVLTQPPQESASPDANQASSVSGQGPVEVNPAVEHAALSAVLEDGGSAPVRLFSGEQATVTREGTRMILTDPRGQERAFNLEDADDRAALQRLDRRLGYHPKLVEGARKSVEQLGAAGRAVIMRDREQVLAVLPPDVRRKVSDTGGDLVEGVFDPNTGTVYIIASEIVTRAGETMEDAGRRVVLHEMVGHYGVRGLLGAESDPAKFRQRVDRFYDLLDPRLKPQLEKIKELYFDPTGERAEAFDPNNQSHRVELMEELIASAAELDVKHPWYKQIVASVRRWLREQGIELRFGDLDVEGIVAQAARYAKRVQSEATGGDARLSLAQVPDVLSTQKVRKGEAGNSKQKVSANPAGRTVEKAMINLDEAKQVGPMKSVDSWRKFMAKVIGAKDGSKVLDPPWRAMEYASGDSHHIDQMLNRLRDDQIQAAEQGLTRAAVFKQKFRDGEAGRLDLSMVMTWGLLSRGVGAYPQESAFMDMIKSGLRDRLSAILERGSMTDGDVKALNKWAKNAGGRKGSGKPGATTSQNTQKVGDLMSALLSPVPSGPYEGRIPLDLLTDLWRNEDSGRKIRREFWKIFPTDGASAQIDNKVLGFVLLVTGHFDNLVLDRVQFRHFWDASRYTLKAGTGNIYDGIKVGQARKTFKTVTKNYQEGKYKDAVAAVSDRLEEMYKAHEKSDKPGQKTIRKEMEAVLSEAGVPSAAAKALVSGRFKYHALKGGLVRAGEKVHGLAVYEAIEESLDGVLPDSFARLGIPYRGVGQFHWMSWLSISGQAIDHSTIQLMLGDQMDGSVGVTQSKYDDPQFGLRYRGDGTFFLPYLTQPGGRILSPSDTKQINSGNLSKAGVLPDGFTFKRGSEYEWEHPWTDDPTIKRAAYDRFIGDLGRPAAVDGGGGGADAGRPGSAVGRGPGGGKPQEGVGKDVSRGEAGSRGPVVTVDPNTFHAALAQNKAANPLGEAVTLLDTPGEYANHKRFLSRDGLATVAVAPDGDIVAVARHPKSTVRRWSQTALRLAVQAGGTHLDAYDAGLGMLYAPEGFRTVARIPFDDKNYSPLGKGFEHVNGRPDIIFMVYDGVSREYVPGEGERVGSYEEAKAMQMAAVEEVRQQQAEVTGMSEPSTGDADVRASRARLRDAQGRPQRGLSARMQDDSRLPQGVVNDLANPEHFYDPQEYAQRETDHQSMSDSELRDGLDRFRSGTAIPASDNWAVFDAAEYMRRQMAAGNWQGVSDILRDLSQEGTKVAQLLRQFQELKNASPQYTVFLITKTIEERGKRLTAAQEKELVALLGADIQARTLRRAAEAAYRDNPDPHTASVLDRATVRAERTSVAWLRRAAIITGRTLPDVWRTLISGNLLTIGTHVLNVSSNIAWNSLRDGAQDLGAVADAVRAKVFNTPRTLGVSRQRAGFSAAMDSLPGVGRGLLTGQSTNQAIKGEPLRGFQPVSAAKALIDTFRGELPVAVDAVTGKVRFRDKVALALEATAGAPAEVNFRLLMAGDEPVKAYRMGSVLEELGRFEGLDGDDLKHFVKAPPKWAFDLAMEEALQSTFQTQNAATGMMAWMRKDPVMDWVHATMIHPFVPFIGTPINVAIQSSRVVVPGIAAVGMLQHLSKAKAAGEGTRAWTYHTRKAMHDAGFVMLNGALTAAVVAMVKVPGLIADRDDDERKREMQYATGVWRTLNVSALRRWIAALGDHAAAEPREGDKLVDLNSLGFPGIAMQAWAAFDRDGDWQMADIPGLGATFANAMAEQTMLRGARSVLDAIADWDRYGNQFMRNFWSVHVSAVMPNTLASLERAMREFRVAQKNPEWGNFKMAVDQRNPFLDLQQMYPLEIDPFGRPIANTPVDRNRWAYHLFDITKRRELRADPYYDLVVPVLDALDNTGALPPVAGNRMDVPKEFVAAQDLQRWKAKDSRELSGSLELTTAQQERLQQIRGEEIRRRLDAFLPGGPRSADWATMAPSRKLYVLERVYSEAQNVGRTRFLREYRDQGGQLRPVGVE